MVRFVYKSQFISYNIDAMQFSMVFLESGGKNTLETLKTFRETKSVLPSEMHWVSNCPYLPFSRCLIARVSNCLVSN